MEKINLKSKKKILVVKLDHIGDVILATPVLRSLKETYPNLEMDVMVSSASYPVIQNSPFIRKIYTYDAIQFDRNHTLNEIVKDQNLKTILDIRHESYDLCIGLREDGANIAILSMMRAKNLLSFNNDTLYQSYLNLYTVQNKKKHAAENNYDLLKLLGVKKPEVIRPEIFTSKYDLDWVDDFMESNNLSREDVIIGVSMGGGWHLNWWPYINYVDLCRKICHYNKSVKIIFIGGKAEEELWRNTVNINPERFVSAMGKTTITQLAALCTKIDLFVTNDGGPMHIASTADKPIIALFGPSPSRRFRPLGNKNVIIKKPCKCSPCPQFEYGKQPQCQNNQCMQSITVDEVLDSVIKVISKIKKVV